LRGLVASARLAFPTIDVDPREFVEYLAERLSPDEPVEQLLETLHAGDLYLACACAKLDPQAIAIFERQFLAQTSSYLTGSNARPVFADEVRQVLRERVLVAPKGNPPRISSYSGRGPLGGWLRMTAARIAIDLRRTERRDVRLDAIPEVRAPSADPELGYLKAKYKKEFRQAFETTLATLTPREASILRLYYLDAMNTKAIGETYRVDERTVRKWLTNARDKILDETRRLLRERLSVKDSELDSLMVLVQSQLDLSIARYLDKAEE
jgi:RNA polymerase sigma-70 factor (ECF subfamily)